MAFTFPLTRAQFLDTLPVQDVRFFIARKDQMNGLGGGEILKAEVAPPVWSGTVSLAPMKARTAAVVETWLAVLEGVGATFEAYRKNQIGPAADPLGAALSGFTPSILDIGVNGDRLKLQGLPVGYNLTVGDMISFTYDTSRQALIRLAENHISADGTTTWLNVRPYARPPEAAPLTAVELIRPWCKAVLVPGSVNYGVTRNGNTSGMAFEFAQTLR